MMVPKQPPGPHCEYMRYQRCFRTVRTEAAASKNHVQVVNLALFAPSITRYNLTVGSCYCSVTRLYTNIFFTIPTPQDAPKRWQQQCSQFLTTISYCLGYMVQFFFPAYWHQWRTSLVPILVGYFKKKDCYRYIPQLPAHLPANPGPIKTCSPEPKVRCPISESSIGKAVRKDTWFFLNFSHMLFKLLPYLCTSSRIYHKLTRN